MRHIRINQSRLWDTLMDMAKIGATKKGGNCRLAATREDKNGRDLFVKWAEQASCNIEIDEIGNIFARRSGKNNALPTIMMGSHLDTQPTGGKFDGVLGVLAGLEVLRTLNDNNVTTNNPIEVVCWTNEEGSRFPPAMMGSGVFVGEFPLKEIMAKEDNHGLKLGDELNKIGYAGNPLKDKQNILAYFELHIEQGPILENKKKTIGVVTGAQGQRWHEINVVGQESHAGPTPMSLRRDALFAASKIVTEVNKIGFKYNPLACATVGCLDIFPNSRNVIPGRAFLTTDLRHPDNKTLLKMDDDLKNFCDGLQNNKEFNISVKDIWYSPPVTFDRNCIDSVRNGARALNYSFCDIVSGAGHDAVYISRVAPTAMIFIQCEGGISHNEIENATIEDCSAGANVLLYSILDVMDKF